MSQQDVQNFLAKANQNPDIFNGLVDAVGDREGAEAFQAVSRYAGSHGFAVTPQDAETARGAILDAAQGDCELRDENMNGAVGGSMIYLTPGATDGIANLLDGVVKTGETVFNWIKKW